MIRRDRERKRRRKQKSLLDFSRGFLSGSFNWVRHKVYPPAWERGRMGVGVFARLQHTPGIRQWDPRTENWVPTSASIWDQNPTPASRSPGDYWYQGYWSRYMAPKPKSKPARFVFAVAMALTILAVMTWDMAAPSLANLSDLPVSISAFVLRARHARACALILSIGSGAHSSDHTGDRTGGRDLGAGPRRMSCPARKGGGGQRL